MNDTTAKFEALERNIETNLRKSKSGIYLVIIIYVVLVSFVFAYTAFIMRELKILAKPPVVAEFIVGQVQSRMPLLTDNIKRNSNAYADVLANRTVEYARSFIPLIGDIAKGQLDETTEVINVKMKEEYLPIVEEYFKLHKVQISEMFNSLTDEQMAVQMNSMLFERLDKELDILNVPLGETINDLDARVNKLANTPNSQLTKQELAQKKIIAYWIFLLNYQEVTGFKNLNLIK